MSDFLHFAARYLECGWPVIPAIGKQPAVAWSTYQHRLPSLGRLRRWFSRPDDSYNLAVITGRYAGLVVVDCDRDEDTLWWQKHFQPTPLVVTTGAGGKHFYYLHPGGQIRSRIRLFGRLIDLRSDSGIVIAPPSVHLKTCQPYRWDGGFCWEPDNIPSFDCRWLADQKPTTTRHAATASADRTESTIRNGAAYIRRIRAIAGHGGHNATFRAACKLRDSGLTTDEALEALLLWNKTNASPPWTVKELAHKVDDAYQNA